MGVDYFSCGNCGEAHSEYDRIYCSKCEQSLCSCAMPDELSKAFGCWEDLWSVIAIDDNDNIISRSDEKEDIDMTEIIKKYCVYDGTTYGLELKKEYCPCCKKEKENEKDPEYQEYLRLKRKFE